MKGAHGSVHVLDCSCNPGFVGADCRTVLSCSDVSECSARGTCVGPSICSCWQGYTGRDCSTAVCAVDGSGVPCGGHGMCVEPNFCSCDAGYRGATCQYTCGDGVVSGGEACDDGNVVAGDGCSAVCEVEAGWKCALRSTVQRWTSVSVNSTSRSLGLLCVDAGRISTSLLPSFQCTASACARCGNGIVEADEQCDDG